MRPALEATFPGGHPGKADIDLHFKLRGLRTSNSELRTPSLELRGSSSEPPGGPNARDLSFSRSRASRFSKSARSPLSRFSRFARVHLARLPRQGFCHVREPALKNGIAYAADRTMLSHQELVLERQTVLPQLPRRPLARLVCVQAFRNWHLPVIDRLPLAGR